MSRDSKGHRCALSAIQQEVGSCREWRHGPNDRCGQPSEYVLWGKLIDPDGLGPRCADCAAQHVGWHALRDPSYALIDLRRLATRTVEAALDREEVR